MELFELEPQLVRSARVMQKVARFHVFFQDASQPQRVLLTCLLSVASMLGSEILGSK